MTLREMAKFLADNLDRELQAADRRLLNVIDGAFEEGARRAGAACVCCPGCTSCCIGPFPITLLDARRLRLVSRPISCRTFGPPTRVGEERLAPCDLWFKSEAAAPARMEACRVEIDRDGLEADLLDDVEAAEQRTGETIVAFALASRNDHD